MNHDEMMEKLEKLYDIAITTKDVRGGLVVVEMMIRTKATEDSAKG